MDDLPEETFPWALGFDFVAGSQKHFLFDLVNEWVECEAKAQKFPLPYLCPRGRKLPSRSL